MKKAMSQKSKGEIVVKSLLLILFVGVITSFAVIAVTKEKPISPDKISSLMLQGSNGSGSGLSTSFTLPE
jgi:hypothetical protein